MRDVVLLTYGEPPAPEFRRQFEYSRRILDGLTRLVAPIPAWLVPALAARRGLLRTMGWRAENFRSPLEDITHAQARGLAEALARLAPGEDWRVRVAYEFRDPTLPAVLADAAPDAVVVPMYVAESEFTHDLARRTIVGMNGTRRGARTLPALPSRTLADLSAAHIAAELDRRGIAGGPDWTLVLAAHGTLLEPKRPMNTGREATEAVACGIARRLEHRFGMIVPAWLNHALGGKWTEPAADAALRALAELGRRKIVYYPYGFLADNAESQLEGRILLRAEKRLEQVVHLPCLNADPGLLDAFASAIVRA